MSSGGHRAPGRSAGDGPGGAGRVVPARAAAHTPGTRAAAERLITLHGDALLATARRYTVTPEDAEDALQRGIEILLAKSPPVSEEELLPWVRTVVKHEAFAIWRGRDRVVAQPDEESLEQAPSPEPSPGEQVERYERLRMGAEAIRRLKPQEMRCLLLRAEGYSYRQICHMTGWTYTKVNRCLTEGRRSFLQRVARIESGAECDRLAPLLSLLADGEATAGDMATLRPHLRSCLACRATLRAFREVPHRAAEVFPVAGAAGAGDAPAALWRWVEAVAGWTQERVALIGAKAQAATEAAGAGKVLAVAASTVALAGGTVAVRSLEGGQAHAGPPAEPERAERLFERPEPREAPVRPSNKPAVTQVEPTAPVPVDAAEPEPPATPALPAPPDPAPPPVPAVDEAPVHTPPPPSLSSDATIPVTGRAGESALPGFDEDGRELEPMTTPADRGAGPPQPPPSTTPPEEEP